MRGTRKKMKTQIKTCLMILVILGVLSATAATTPPLTDESTQKRIEELIAQLGDEKDSVRRDAAWNLGRIADSKTAKPFAKEAVQPLIKALADKQSGVRTYAAYALGKIGDLTALHPLINTLEDSDSNVRLFAANALGALGDPQAEQPLNNLLKDKDGRVQKAVANALKQIKIKAAAQEQIKKEAPKEETQTTQEEQFKETEKKQTLPVKSTYTQKRIEGFIRQLGDTNVRVRNSAVKHLRAIGKPAEQPLIKALENSDPNVRQLAATLLGDIGDVLAIKPLYKVLNEGNSNISKSAGLALGKIRRRVTSEEWDKAVQEYRDSRRLEMEREMAKEVERRRLAIPSRRRTIRRPPFVPPRPPVVQPRPPVVQPSPTIGQGFLLRPRNMSIPAFILVSIIGLAISSVIMSIFVFLATKVVVRYDISFGDAYTIAFLIALITFLIRLVTAYINEPAFYVSQVISHLLVVPFIYGRMIDSGEGPIGYVKGLLVHICVIVATFLVIFGISFLCLIILRSGMR